MVVVVVVEGGVSPAAGCAHSPRMRGWAACAEWSGSAGSRGHPVLAGGARACKEMNGFMKH